MTPITIPPDYVLVYIRNSPGSGFVQSLPYVGAVIHRDNFGPDHTVNDAERVVLKMQVERNSNFLARDGKAFASAWERSD